MSTDYEIRGEFEEIYRYCHDYWAPFVRNAQVYTLAASGYTWSDNELKELTKEGREPLELNIMRRPLQFFSGYLRDNLNSVVVSPVEGSDQKTADQFTKLQYYIWDKGGGYNTFLDACDEGFKAGISLCGIQMDYTKDFINGEISFYNRTFNSFYLDPTFQKIDLSDCAFAITRDLLSKPLVKQLLPFVSTEVIDNIHGSFRDNKFRSYHPNFTTLSRNRNLMAYDQYYKKVTRTRKFLVDESTGFFRDITDLPSDEKEVLEKGINRIMRLHEEFDRAGKDRSKLPVILKTQSVEREFVELNIMLNGIRVYCGDDKTGINQTFPFAPCICYLEPSIWMPSQRLQGIASTLWSAQRQFNKRHMKIVDMMDSTIATGFKYLLGSVPDPQDMQQSGQNKLIGVDPEHAPAGLDSVQQLEGGTASPALIEYQGILDQLTLTLANINESVLGVDEGGNTQVSGRLAQVRIAQGLRGNRKIFDNVELTQTILGGLVLKAIQNNYTPAKIERILGEQPTQQFYEKDFEQYDAVLKEGVRSQSQKDAYYYELVNLKREGIVDIPQDEITKNLPIAGLSDLQEAIAEQQKKQQEQEQKIDQQEQIQMKLQNAKINAENSLSAVRQAREHGELALAEERVSEAAENRAQAALARAKTITEIANMQTDRVLRVAEFVKSLELEEKGEQEVISERVKEEANAIEESILVDTAMTENQQQQPVNDSTNEIGEG